jgi:RNA polymerase sigma-70 factor (ECF subfamily)
MGDGARAHEAFQEFYAREYGRLAGAMRLVCSRRDDAEDVAQEAMVRACLHWKRVREMERPQGWVYATAFNLVRRERRRRAPDATAAVAQASAPEERLDLTVALASLPLSQRKAVVLRYVLGYSTAEAADLLDTTPGAVRAVLHRACVALRLQPALREVEPEP